MADIEHLLTELTLAEKESLLNGDSMWIVPGVDRLGIPTLVVTDGPAGARGSGFRDSGTPTLCIPCGSALGATWNPELLTELGAALGREARAKGARVLLAPTINLHRHPLGGRNFECYSEDPELAGRLAAGFVRGVQSVGVGTTPKHFVANDAEFERNTINSVVDERALRELYLRPFEIALSGPDQAWGVMAAYNRLNGTFCPENRWLLTSVLRDEWGFDGFVVTDWFAARSTAASANAGLDLEMPGPGRFFGEGSLSAAVEAGEVEEAVVDEMVRRMLRLLDRTGSFDDPPAEGERTVDSPEDRALARRAAAEAIVLLRNEGGLVPLDPAGIARVAVIGANVGRAQIMGGGSAGVRAYRYRTPLDELSERLGDGVEVVYERGCDIDRTAPPIAMPMRVTYWAADDPDGEPVHTGDLPAATLISVGVRPPVPADWRARATGSFTAADTGRHTLSLIGIGPTRVLRGGEVLLEVTAETPRGDNFFGLGSIDLVVPFDLTEGEEVQLEVEAGGAFGFGGFQLGLFPPVADDLMDRAVAAAAGADVAVVVVGTNDDWETEGHDRATMDLPGDQDELVRQVAAVCDRTVVVVNAGSPVSMPWADDVPAVLDMWFGGQEMASALVDVLLGETDPSGRLPTSFPVDMRHAPSHLNFPGENGEVRYGESVFMGYRGYEATGRPVRFPFGHGLSTTTFELGAPVVSATSSSSSSSTTTIAAGDELTVAVEVTNTGPRRGAQVVQCYASQDEPKLARPPKELVAFTKVWLDPGESHTAELALDARALAHFDPGDPHYEELRSGMPVPSGGGSTRRSSGGWVVDPGGYTLHVGTSSAAIAHTASVMVADADV